MVDARRPVRPILRRRAARRRPGPGSPRTHGTAGCPWADVDARPHFGRYGHGLIGSTEIVAYSCLTASNNVWASSRASVGVMTLITGQDSSYRRTKQIESARPSTSAK